MTPEPPASDVSHDAFLGGRLTIQQARNGLRAGLDAVFLAASVPKAVSRPLRLLDVGTGCGVVGLCALRRVPELSLVGIDQSEMLIDLAQRNAAANGLEQRAEFKVGDVRTIAETMTTCGLTPNSFDHVVANPPFFEQGKVLHAPDAIKDRAHVMAPGDLDLWVRFMVQATKSGGSITLVHTCEALPALLAAMNGRFGRIVAVPLFPRTGAPAHRVLVQARKGSRAPFSLHRGVVIHEPDGSFTPAAERILRHGDGLELP